MEATRLQRDINTTWFQTYISLEIKKKLEVTTVGFISVVFLSGIFILFIMGGGIYAEEHPKEISFRRHHCFVYNIEFRQYRCSRRRPEPICFGPVWHVSYEENEIYNAEIIEYTRYETMPLANQRAEDYQNGSSYICWCNPEDRKEAQWERPDDRLGKILMFFGGITTILTVVTLLFIYRFCSRVLKEEEEEEGIGATYETK